MSIADHLGADDRGASKPEPTGTAKLNADGVTIAGALVDQEGADRIAAGDWTPVLAIFNLDPAVFEVVDDTVQMSITSSTWQQSKRTDNGDRDVVDLYSRRYSYSARFRRIKRDEIRPEVVESWRAALQTRIVIPHDEPGPVSIAAGTYIVLVADPQLGKKGTDEAVHNWRRGVAAHMRRARELADAGDVERVHIAFMGDETEGVANNYGNQAHTTELNLSRQLELDYDLRVWTLDQAVDVGRPVTASSVISNHGEWTRNGSKEPVTSQNDNASTYIARQVRKQFDRLAPFTGHHIEWTIGDTHPGIVLDLSGALWYLSHGYIEKGRGPSTEIRTKQAIERQIIGRTAELGHVDVYGMAHYHHHYSNEFEGRTLFGCPAIEAEKSSEYMLDQFGVWSPPGVLGMVTGRHFGRRKWSDLNVW